jgi:hypothetical protein
VSITKLLPGIPIVESPLYRSLVEDLDFTPDERRIADSLHENGYALIDFPDPDIADRAERIKRNLAPRFGLDPADPSRREPCTPRRVQDAWMEDEDVRAVAANADILTLLERIYGRPAVPFQTLNFPVGTEQKLHSDSNHFSSIPERFMCGVWLALEDVHEDAGPLTYAPGSHKWPIISNLMIGRRVKDSWTESAQAPFEQVWEALLRATGSRQELLIVRKGQALIWAANLLHGGSMQHDQSLTRWSQVTHYYFKDCIYYTPAHSEETLGHYDLRSITNIATGLPEENSYLAERFARPSDNRATIEKTVRSPRWPWSRRKSGPSFEPAVALPDDFDPVIYLQLNPDVAAAKQDPATHYQLHGYKERRTYRR